MGTRQHQLHHIRPFILLFFPFLLLPFAAHSRTVHGNLESVKSSPINFYQHVQRSVGRCPSVRQSVEYVDVTVSEVDECAIRCKHNITCGFFTYDSAQAACVTYRSCVDSRVEKPVEVYMMSHMVADEVQGDDEVCPAPWWRRVDTVHECEKRIIRFLTSIGESAGTFTFTYNNESSSCNRQVVQDNSSSVSTITKPQVVCVAVDVYPLGDSCVLSA